LIFKFFVFFHKFVAQNAKERFIIQTYQEYNLAMLHHQKEGASETSPSSQVAAKG